MLALTVPVARKMGINKSTLWYLAESCSIQETTMRLWKNRECHLWAKEVREAKSTLSLSVIG